METQFQGARAACDLCREVKRNYGGKGSARVLEANTGVVVCTIEKANSLINRMSEERCLSSLSCVVVDELHMVKPLVILTVLNGRFKCIAFSPLSARR